MRTKLLTTKFKIPLLLMHFEEYNIYVDESISYQQIREHVFPELFVTAFCIIRANNLRKFNTSYFKYVYKSGKNVEIKSTYVSDKENRNILKMVKKYIIKSLFFTRPAQTLEFFEHNKQALGLTLELRSYIAPIEKLVQALKIDPSTHCVKINVFIDQTSKNGIDPYLNYSKEFLNKIENKFSTQNLKYDFSYQVVDSKKSYGIQLADMLAGAYRKEHCYFKNNEKVKVIPFTYLLEEGTKKLKDDQKFLKLFGCVAYTRLLLGPDAEELPAWKYSQKWYCSIKNLRVEIYRFFNKIIVNRNLLSTIFKTNVLLNDCDNLDSNSKRKQVLEEILSLNKMLRPIALINGLNANEFILHFSTKVKDKNYHKTIFYIRTNIKNVQNVQKVIPKNGYISFNRNILRILKN